MRKQNLFLLCSILTGTGFFIIGWMKSYVTHTKKGKGVLETLLLGAVAGLVSYFVGDLLEGIIEN